MPYRNIPIVTRTLTIRSPRGVLLMVPLFPVVVSILLVSLVFTIWPEALEHSPISFEQRGIIHHVWHYSLLVGSILALWGMFSPKPHRMPIEAAGLIVLITALTMNLVALLDELFKETPHAEVSGLALFIRVGIIAMFGIRTYILIVQPTIRLPQTPANGDDVR